MIIGKKWKLASLTVAALALHGCSQANESDDSAQAGIELPGSVATRSAPVSVGTTSNVTMEQTVTICKKAMETLFGQSPDIMKAEQQPGDIIRISYRRTSDRTLWTNDCRLDGSRIMWRSVDATPGSGPGRWRDDPADGLLSYTINGNDIEVVETY